MLKQKAFNYLTLILAIMTLFTALFAIETKKDMVICTIMLVITIIFYLISNKYNNQNIKLTKEDREAIKSANYISKEEKKKKSKNK
jgi:hypothetical protein